VVIVDRGTAPITANGSGNQVVSTARPSEQRESTTAVSESGGTTSVAHDNIAEPDHVLRVGHAEPRGTRTQPDGNAESEPAGPSGTSAAPVPPVDLTPLVDLIADLARKNAELTEAATAWQFRAIRAEDQIKQLTAGEASTVAENGASRGSGDATGRDGQSDTPQSSRGTTARSWWRRLVGLS
jgi:hypothetical protein